MKKVFKVLDFIVMCAVMAVFGFKQGVRVSALESEVEYLQFMDSLQSSRIDLLREHVFMADSMLLEAIKATKEP